MQETSKDKENSGKIENSGAYNDALWQKVYEAAEVSKRFAKNK